MFYQFFDSRSYPEEAWIDVFKVEMFLAGVLIVEASKLESGTIDNLGRKLHEYEEGLQFLDEKTRPDVASYRNLISDQIESVFAYISESASCTTSLRPSTSVLRECCSRNPEFGSFVEGLNETD